MYPDELTVSADRHWAAAMRTAQVAEGLYVNVCRSGPNGIAKAAARGALLGAMDVIRLNPLRDFKTDWQAMYWAGLLEGVMRVVVGAEREMKGDEG